MAVEHTHPLSITGGCLCGSIRYDIDLSDKYEWPPQSATCQCTMCRKWTASLVAQFIVVKPAQISPDLKSFATYREYNSATKRFRGFCGQCGSPLIWRSEDNTETLDLYLGTIDERWLVGAKVAGSEKETEFGTAVERRGGIGKQLATPNQFQFWYENAIKGVTDILEGGQKYLKESTDGNPLD
ncbi:Mss4-like protein [Xylogone sp. PMI_703]|nr:Mss4-like protein [Xylogone sp. PMI_703]